MSKIQYAMDNPEARAIVEEMSMAEHRRRMAEHEMSRMKQVGDYRDEIKELATKPKEERGIALPWQNCKDVLLEPNRISIVGGANGHMKSTWTSQLAIHVAKQKPVAIMSLELDMQTQGEILCKQILAEDRLLESDVDKACDWAHDRVWLYSWQKKSTIDRALGFLYAAAELGCGLAIIDNLQKLGIGHNDNDAQNDAFEALLEVANNNPVGMHVILVHHVAKPPGNVPDWRPNRYSLRGSSGMSDKTDNIFMTYHNKPRARARWKPADERDNEDRRLITEEFDFELIIEKLRNQPGERVEYFYEGAGRTLQLRAGGNELRCIYD